MKAVHDPTAFQRCPQIRVPDVDAWKSRTAQKIETHTAWRQSLRGCSVGNLANETVTVFPSRVRRQYGGAIQGKQLARRMHGLGKANHLADSKGNARRVALKIVFARKTFLFGEVVIDISVHLGGVELARRAFYEGIERLATAFRVRRV